MIEETSESEKHERYFFYGFSDCVNNRVAESPGSYIDSMSASFEVCVCPLKDPAFQGRTHIHLYSNQIWLSGLLHRNL